MYTVYVLYSDLHKKHYTGYTSDIEARFKSHNELSESGWTIKYRPWRILHSEEFEEKKMAMQREKWLKSGVGRSFIKTLIY
jgi:putative endonuclease